MLSLVQIKLNQHPKSNYYSIIDIGRNFQKLQHKQVKFILVLPEFMEVVQVHNKCWREG